MLKLKQYSISLVVSYIISIVFLCLSAALFTYTNIDDRHLDSFVFGIVMVSVLVGSLLLLRKIREKGLIYGALFGFLFVFFIYFISVLAYQGFFFTNTLMLYSAISILSGVVGGVIGVNV